MPEEREGGEAAPRLDVRLLEPVDGKFRGSNVPQNIGLLVIVRVQRVVRLLPRFLQHDELPPLLADAFKRAGIVERTARGIDTIFHEQLRNGRPAPGYERSTEAGVTLVLPGGEPNLGFVRLVAEEGWQGRPLSPDELLLLNAFEREPLLTASRAAATIQKGEGEAEAVLRKLCERGIAEARGASSRKAFRLSEVAGRRLGDRSDVRGGRIVSIRHDELVRRHVEKHGSISRREAAELCALTAPQAYRLLKKMVSDGILRRVGATGRGARYEGSA